MDMELLQRNPRGRPRPAAPPGSGARGPQPVVRGHTPAEAGSPILDRLQRQRSLPLRAYRTMRRKPMHRVARLRNDRGAVAVIVAIVMVVLLGAAALAIDAGNL